MKRKGWMLLLVFCGLLLAVDIGSKLWVHSGLPHVRESIPAYPYGGIKVFKRGIEFSINHATNTGAIWGAFAGHPYILVGIRIAVVLGLVWYLIYGKRSRAAVPPLAMVIVGALGNIIDILAYGHVVDMFHFSFWGHHYPIFNFADAIIFLGVAWLLILSFVKKKDPGAGIKMDDHPGASGSQ